MWWRPAALALDAVGPFTPTLELAGFGGLADNKMTPPWSSG
jgi:hypothetical protein